MPPFASFRSKPLAWKSIVVSHPFSHHPSRSIPRSISQPVPGRSTFSNNCVIEFRSHRSPPKTFARAMPPSGDVRQGGDDAPPKTRVLFVCLGNICRSPTAEAVFRAVVERNGLGDRFDIASCGTGGGSSNWYKPGGFSYHEGDPSDPRMLRTAAARGVKLTSFSRPLKPRDLSRFDYIIGMDDKNLRDITTAADFWRETRAADNIPDKSATAGKVTMMTQFAQGNFKGKYPGGVPDPYYGGDAGFNLVLDLLDDACEGLLTTIRKEKGI